MLRPLLPLVMVVFLGGCFGFGEPSDSQAKQAVVTALDKEVKNAVASAGIFGAALMGDVSVSVNNFQKLSCDKDSSKVYICDVYADVSMHFPEETANLMLLFGGGSGLNQQISGKIKFIKTDSGWVALDVAI